MVTRSGGYVTLLIGSVATVTPPRGRGSAEANVLTGPDQHHFECPDEDRPRTR